MTKKQIRMLRQILIAVVLYILALVLPVPDRVHTVLFLMAYAWIGYDILLRAVKNIRNGQVFDENFLMAIASVGALCLGQYSESVAVVLFYQIGEWFQSYAVNRSRRSIASLMDIRPDYANIEVNGQLRQVDPYEVSRDDTIVVQPGERIPLDGKVVEGSSSLDTSALTGESIPRTVSVDDEVISGCINQSGLLRIKVEKVFDDSTVAKILELVENASDRKSKSEDFITGFARYYTPVVVYAALVLAIVPSLLFGNGAIWIYRALTFLVISCPCALVISVPLSFFGGIGGASHRGILIKGSNFLETLSNVDTIVFDKTGTLTKGKFSVAKVYPVHCTEQQCLEWMAYAESYSNHPISKSIKEAYGKRIDYSQVENVEEIAGHGVKAIVKGHLLYAGNNTLMDRIGIHSFQKGTGLGTMVHLACDGQYMGSIEIADSIKEDSKQVISALKKHGIKQVIMLTGDSADVAHAVSQAVGIDEYHAQLLPGDKVDYMEKLMDQKQIDHKLAFVGDGINDAPVLTRADVGIAMGALGSDAAIEAADIVLMDDRLDSIVTAIQISRKTLTIAQQNIYFAIGIKLFILLLGAFGLVGMWAAVFADVGVAFLCILNAMRCMRI